MIPLGDDLPTLRAPWGTYGIIAACFGAWFLVQGAGADPELLVSSVCNLGMVPGEITHRAPLGSGIPIAPGLICQIDNDPINSFTPLISMFLHGSWGHIVINMLFFYVFGRHVEDSMGRGRFVVFYLVCGLAAAATHIALNASSPVPTVGASGAISGVMGAYLVLYPRARVRMLFPPFFIFSLAAWLVLVYWFVTQVIAGLQELMTVRPDVSGGVAVWAHVGGFVAGIALIGLFADRQLTEAHRGAGRGRYSRGGPWWFGPG